MKLLKSMTNRAKLIIGIALVILLSAIVIFFTVSFTVSDNEIAYVEKQVADGDIIFQTSKSKYDSPGIIFIKDGRPVVFEVMGKVVQTPLENWIKKGAEGRFVVKRLQDYEVSLTPEVIEKLKKTAEGLIAKENISSPELITKIYKESANIEISMADVLNSREWYIVVDNLP
ncbi:MAG TPA: hypothetical protein PLZ43_11610 [bacterium]|nr:hypothetical protein [bacterium]